MVSRPFRCDPNRLRLLLDEQLPEHRQAEMARHIEICQSCRQKLESLAAAPPLWREAEQSLRAEPLSQSPTTSLPGGDPGSMGPPSDEGPVADESPPLDFLAPSDDPQKLGRLGPYEIAEVIGCGGMGVVLKGFDSVLNRYVAVKVLAPALASSAAARRRFAREARAAAAVNHEHVVAIHAVDSAAGLPYLVMPWVRGESLQGRIRRHGPLAIKEILRIGMQTASGLAAAHAQGLVHRDVKPANILLENGVERVMITDFGLARAADDASFTRSGVVAGTPQYMAPEQANAETVDHRADLFSLGSVLYAMGAGHPPFRAETTLAVLRRICDGRPRPIRDVNPEIPEWLAEIIEKLHEKDPADRFQTAAEVAELLSRHLAHLQQPAAAPMPARLKRGSVSKAALWRHWIRRTIAAVLCVLTIGIAATIVVGLVGGPGVMEEVPRESEPRPVSELPRPQSTPAASTASVKSESLESAESSRAPYAGQLGGGFEEDIAQIRWRLAELEHGSEPAAAEIRPRDPLSVIGGQLDALEAESREGRTDESAASLSAIRVRLDALERDGFREESSDAPSADAALSGIGARLDEIELELSRDPP